MTPYILSEHPEYNPNYAITVSREMMDGNKFRLFCLNLMGVPTSHMPYLFDRGRSTIYNKNRDLLAKLGIKRTSATFKEDLKSFLEKEK